LFVKFFQKTDLTNTKFLKILVKKMVFGSGIRYIYDEGFPFFIPIKFGDKYAVKYT